MNINETETQIRLRRANETLAACRAAENDLRKALAAAIECTRTAKEKVEELFLKNQNEARKKLMSEYRHSTK